MNWMVGLGLWFIGYGFGFAVATFCARRQFKSLQDSWEKLKLAIDRLREYHKEAKREIRNLEGNNHSLRKEIVHLREEVERLAVND